jgi:hypothetical protein
LFSLCHIGFVSINNLVARSSHMFVHHKGEPEVKLKPFR